MTPPETAEMTMDIDTEKVDEAVLAVLYLTLHDRVRVWKGVDGDVLARLHEKGLIHDPVRADPPIRSFSERAVVAAGRSTSTLGAGVDLGATRRLTQQTTALIEKTPRRS